MDNSSKVQGFEDLNVYKQARILTNKIYELTRQGIFQKDYGLVDQIRRASISVMSNIAEGFERGSNQELIQFLYIAKASCGEVRAQLTIAYDQKYIDENNYKQLINQSRLIGGMLGNLITYIKGSKYRGPKYKKPPIKSMKDELDEFLNQYKKDTPNL
jgi:four helix bundle protein